MDGVTKIVNDSTAVILQALQYPFSSRLEENRTEGFVARAQNRKQKNQLQGKYTKGL